MGRVKGYESEFNRFGVGVEDDPLPPCRPEGFSRREYSLFLFFSLPLSVCLSQVTNEYGHSVIVVYLSC